MSQVDAFIAQIPGKGSGGANLARLTDDSRAALEAFQEWLVAEDDKKESTARAYKGYAAEAMVHVIDGGDISELSTDVKSALNALKRFSQSEAAKPYIQAVADKTVEDEIEE